MSRLLSSLLLGFINLFGFVVAFIKSFVCYLKDKVDHSGYSKKVVGKIKAKANEAKSWLYAFLSRLQHSPTYC